MKKQQQDTYSQEKNAITCVQSMEEKQDVSTEEVKKSTIDAIEEEIKDLQESEVEDESIRVQKAKWVREQVEKQREIEDATRERIEQEQKMLDEMKRSTEEHLERTKELRRFNEDTRKQMRQQVYELNGISEDKLQGMKEYKNAYYQGMAFAFFLLSIALVGLSGYLHGFDSQICLFMVSFAGIEGALLSQESKRGKILEAICRFLYILMFPAMLVIFVCYELQFPQYEFLLPYFVMVGCGILVLGTIAYFVYNPYRKEKKKIRSAKEDLKEIEDEAEKAVRRNQRRRKREAARLARKQEKVKKRLEKQQRREERKQENKEKQEKARFERKQKWEEYKLLLKNKKNEVAARLEKKTANDTEEIVDVADIASEDKTKAIDTTIEERDGVEQNKNKKEEKVLPFQNKDTFADEKEEILDATEVTPVKEKSK